MNLQLPLFKHAFFWHMRILDRLHIFGVNRHLYLFDETAFIGNRCNLRFKVTFHDEHKRIVKVLRQTGPRHNKRSAADGARIHVRAYQILAMTAEFFFIVCTTQAGE